MTPGAPSMSRLHPRKLASTQAASASSCASSVDSAKAHLAAVSDAHAITFLARFSFLAAAPLPPAAAAPGAAALSATRAPRLRPIWLRDMPRRGDSETTRRRRDDDERRRRETTTTKRHGKNKEKVGENSNVLTNTPIVLNATNIRLRSCEGDGALFFSASRVETSRHTYCSDVHSPWRGC